MEEIIFQIIAKSGNGKALAYEAINESFVGNFEQAKKLLKEADESLKEAHNTQTQLITDEVNGKQIEITMLFVHAQDHLMSAVEVRDLANLFIKQNIRIQELEYKVNEKNE
ncbi:PTS lactose/cellobiose transporter subunit IIA [Aerococcaceae bacterium DSM 111020]|nr:PTS lactose/cellobiose transporter subunit IIA [Aerococcaceae bacterium DSM 111020]